MKMMFLCLSVCFAVPINSSSAFLSRPTSTFLVLMSLSIAVIVLTTSVALAHSLHRVKLKRCRYPLIPCIQTGLERNMIEISGKKW